MTGALGREVPRHAWGLLLATAGAFAVAAALTLLVIAPPLVLYPADLSVRSVATAKNAIVFYPGDLKLRTDVEARAVQTVGADPSAVRAGPDVAAYRTGSVLTDADGTLLSAGRYGFCVNRETHEEQPGCGTGRTAEEPWAAFGGPVSSFPAGTEAHDYTFYDPTLGTNVIARYTRDGTIDGLPAMRFEQKVPKTVVDEREVPGELVTGGRRGTSATANVTYEGERVMWVEPASGTIVSRAEQRTIFVNGPDGKLLYPIFVGTLVLDPASQSAAVARGSAAGFRISMLETTLPGVLGTVGVLLLAAGGWLALRDRRTADIPAGVPEDDRTPAPVG